VKGVVKRQTLKEPMYRNNIKKLPARTWGSIGTLALVVSMLD